jgi:hypothetical protein
MTVLKNGSKKLSMNHFLIRLWHKKTRGTVLSDEKRPGWHLFRAQGVYCIERYGRKTVNWGNKF